MGKIQKIKKYFLYSMEDLIEVYELLVSFSVRSYNEGNISNSLKCIEAAALLQYNLNYYYSDSHLNEILRQISLLFEKKEKINVNNNTICFIDSFARDNHGLTQQYLDALFKNQFKLIYISEIRDIGSKIFKLLEDNHAKIFKVDNLSILEEVKRIIEILKIEAPSSVYYHLSPNSIGPIIAGYYVSEMHNVQINLTDHGFWLGGADLFNSMLEFRTFGLRLSREKRNFSENQLVLMPFYPWTENIPFEGFPIDTTGKVVMFSGGAMYKTEGGGGKFFSILKQIMDEYPEVVFFYAGDGNKTHFETFISDNEYHDRMFLLGQRDDINEVFKHSDIYYSTYPLFGGLMSQYAAINGIPILAYGNEEIESVVCTKKPAHFTFNSEESLIEEAGKLIENPDYRRERSDFFKGLCIDQEEFRARMRRWMETSVKPELSYETKPIDYASFCKENVERINNGCQGLGIELMLLRRCPKAMTWKMWMNVLMNIPEVIRVQKRRKTIN